MGRPQNVSILPDQEQTPEQMGDVLRGFLSTYPAAVVLEDGRQIFELSRTQSKVSVAGGRCALELWSEQRNFVRTVVSVQNRRGSLRVATRRLGQQGNQLLELRALAEPRTPARKEPARQGYLRLLERVLARNFDGWAPESFRMAMDLERSFGPAYARGVQVRGREAWAVIGVSQGETQAIVDGVLTIGILWLHHCREQAGGRHLFTGLRLILPRGGAMLTLARVPWLRSNLAAWEVYQLDEATEDLVQLDPTDQGNLLTRLIHHPDLHAARDRFAGAIHQVMSLLPQHEWSRVEQRLRSSTELVFLLHGLAFARARVSLAAQSFAHTLEVLVGAGHEEVALTVANTADIRAHLAELFARRSSLAASARSSFRPATAGKRIGAFTGRPAHARWGVGGREQGEVAERSSLADRWDGGPAQRDPLFRAAPERWLESVLRENLAPLTRSLAPGPLGSDMFSASERVIPRFDPRFVYSQVPAVAGAGDRGMMDLLGITEDGRLAVIELKANDDLQFALQGLDYWIRVRHHHAAQLQGGSAHGESSFHRHGYFREVVLSPLPPRLFLVAPALHIHPATETVLRYLSPEVEWTLLALDERWRQGIRVVWRRSGGRSSAGAQA